MLEPKILIRDQHYDGQRPLFAAQGVRIEHSCFHPGHGALQQARHIEVCHCDFHSHRPFLHSKHIAVASSTFHGQSQEAFWYAHHLKLTRSQIDAAKLFRHVDGLMIESCRFSDAMETGWGCRDVHLRHVTVQNGDYLFMNTEAIHAENVHLQGDSLFDGARNIEIHNAVLLSHGALWNSENVTLYDSILDGDELGWYSKDLKLVNCRIRGRQPLCFATGLVLQGCQLDENCEDCFENSSLQADLLGTISSIRNPRSGMIAADQFGSIIQDEHIQPPGNCLLRCREHR